MVNQDWFFKKKNDGSKLILKILVFKVKPKIYHTAQDSKFIPWQNIIMEPQVWQPHEGKQIITLLQSKDSVIPGCVLAKYLTDITAVIMKSSNPMS